MSKFASRIQTLPQRMLRKLRRRRSRSGIAVVEFAICLPILMAMVMGVIEASNAVFLQQALTSASYEAANVASAIGGTSAEATTRANAVLTALGIKNSTVSISPTVTTATPIGTTIVVTVSAPFASNSLVFGYIGSPTLSAKITIPHL